MVAEVVVISIFLFGCCMSIFPAGTMVQDLEVSRLLCLLVPRLHPPSPAPILPAVLRMPSCPSAFRFPRLSASAPKALQRCMEATNARLSNHLRLPGVQSP